MGQILTGIFVAVAATAIASWLGFGNSKTVVHVHGGRRVSKGWKVTTIIGWLMLFGGGYYFLAWLSVAGFTDPRTGIGLSIAVLGLIIYPLGRLGLWWSRD
ncbi:hypothetical protein KGM48_01425 [Patescibacteria group bacterium]|nr:hypothetical protein [Patescibacteria group bacterium]